MLIELKNMPFTIELLLISLIFKYTLNERYRRINHDLTIPSNHRCSVDGFAKFVRATYQEKCFLSKTQRC